MSNIGGTRGVEKAREIYFGGHIAASQTMVLDFNKNHVRFLKTVPNFQENIP